MWFDATTLRLSFSDSFKCDVMWCGTVRHNDATLQNVITAKLNGECYIIDVAIHIDSGLWCVFNQMFSLDKHWDAKWNVLGSWSLGNTRYVVLVCTQNDFKPISHLVYLNKLLLGLVLLGVGFHFDLHYTKFYHSISHWANANWAKVVKHVPNVYPPFHVFELKTLPRNLWPI